MNKNSVILSVLGGLVVVLVLALLISQAAAKSSFREYEATQWICIIEIDPDQTEMWQAGNTLHARNVFQHTYVTSEEPDIVGPMLATVNWNVNLGKEQGAAYGTFRKEIEGRGAWTGTFNGQLHAADPPVYDIFGGEAYLMEGKVVGVGEGEFEGKKLKANFTQEGYDPAVSDHPCEEAFGYPQPMLPVLAHIEGRIIENADD